MALLQLVHEEPIGDETADCYFETLYRVVCVGERPAVDRVGGKVVRSTYIVDWEQLVHLLEEYEGFGEDIVEVTALPQHDAPGLRLLSEQGTVAQA